MSATTRCPLYSMSAIDRFDCTHFFNVPEQLRPEQLRSNYEQDKLKTKRHRKGANLESNLMAFAKSLNLIFHYGVFVEIWVSFIQNNTQTYHSLTASFSHIYLMKEGTTSHKPESCVLSVLSLLFFFGWGGERGKDEKRLSLLYFMMSQFQGHRKKYMMYKVKAQMTRFNVNNVILSNLNTNSLALKFELRLN